MSDVEDNVPMAAAGNVVSMNIDTAVKEVLKSALIVDGLARGLHETARCLDKREALLCVLAEDCEQKGYKDLVQALCQTHKIPLIKVDSGQNLGEWTGLCKLDKDGKARKVIRTSSAVIRSWGKGGPELELVQEYIKSRQRE